MCHVSTTPPPGAGPGQENRRVGTTLQVIAEGDVEMPSMASVARIEEEGDRPEATRELGIARAVIANDRRP